MTLCIALKCYDNNNEPSILFAADTQIGNGDIKTNATKLRAYLGPGEPFEKNQEEYGVVVAISGDAFMADEVFFELMGLFHDKIPLNSESVAIDLLNLRTEIGDITYDVYRKYEERGVDNSIRLLVGASDIKQTILEVDQSGRTYFLDNFGIIGHGMYTGGLLLLNELFKDDLSIWSAAHLASFIIKIVNKVDTTVGDEVQFKICRNGKQDNWIPEAHELLQLEPEEDWDILRNLYWRMRFNPDIRNKLKKIAR